MNRIGLALMPSYFLVLLTVLQLSSPFSQALEVGRLCADRLGRPIRGVDWDRTDAKAIFQALVAEGISLNQSEIKRKYETRTNAVLKRLGLKVRANGFVLGVRKRYGSWDSALAANGYDPIDYRKLYDPTSAEQLLSAVRALHAAGVPLNAGAVAKNDSRQAKVILRNAIGIVISAEAVYFRAVKVFGDWPASLRAAGLAVDQIVMESQLSASEWTPDFALDLIRLLGREFSDLNVSALAKMVMPSAKRSSDTPVGSCPYSLWPVTPRACLGRGPRHLRRPDSMRGRSAGPAAPVGPRIW